MDFRYGTLLIGIITYVITGQLFGGDIEPIPSEILFRIDTPDERPVDIILNDKNEYLLLTSKNDYGILRKISKNGNVVWKVKLNPRNNDFRTGQVEQIKGNYYVVGYEWVEGGGTMLFKVSESGSISWMKKYTIDSPRYSFMSKYPKGKWIIGNENESNGYLVGGIVFTGQHVGGSIYYSKIDIDGNKIWEEHTIEGTPFDVCLAPDGDLVIVGKQSQIGMIIKYNKDSGEKKWLRGNWNAERLVAVSVTNNGGFIAAGSSHRNRTLILTKYDRHGFLEYEGSYGELDNIAFPSDVMEVHDNFYVPFPLYNEKGYYLLVANSTLTNIEVYKTPANFKKLLKSGNSILALSYETDETVLYRINL